MFAHEVGQALPVGGARTVVVGGGILGLAFARAALLAEPGRSVTVLEKGEAVAQQQSGRNSGVVHAGIYYAPGSLKARLCREGGDALEGFCREHGITFERCGKVVVATDEAERARLEGLLERSLANEVPGVRLVDRAELRELEPHVDGLAAIHSPHTGIVDFPGVCRALASEVAGLGGEVRLRSEVTSVEQGEDDVRVGLAGGEQLVAERLVICGGLQSDRVARLAGGDQWPAIVPFRGEYWALKPDRRDLVRALVYPVPDPRYPFLGVHLTLRFDGEVLVGPNAVTALAREGYRWRDVVPGDVAELLGSPGFRGLARQNLRTGVHEVVRSFSKRRFAAAAARYVPELTADDLVRASAGVRAQAVAKDGSLVDDFAIEQTPRVLAVRNAPSPAATSSLAIANHLVRRWQTLA
jgi:L-2-hydroxyglutarate oxidase